MHLPFCHLGHPAEAEQHSSAAIEQYQSGLPEGRSYGDEALARLDITNARLTAGDIEGAKEAIEPVLVLLEDLRIRQMDTALRRTRAEFAALASRSRAALDLVRTIDDQFELRLPGQRR